MVVSGRVTKKKKTPVESVCLGPVVSKNMFLFCFVPFVPCPSVFPLESMAFSVFGNTMV